MHNQTSQHVTPPATKSAFSLVELSIVLVILGLLVGGVLSGQSLIRAAELRSVTTEYQRYVSATHSFQDKYFALPGDMPNATSFWLAANADPTTCRTTSSNTPATCDGGGNGQIETMDSGTTFSERHRYWQHLANAGLIEGSYTGIGGAAGVGRVDIGISAPKSKLNNAGWGLRYLGSIPAVGTYYIGNFNNVYEFGREGGTNLPDEAGLKPEELWNIDTKLDDGKPAHGIVQTRTATSRPNCSSSDSASNAIYSLITASSTCMIVMKTGF